MLPNNIELLSKLEKEQNVLGVFYYKNTTAWVKVKDFLIASMYDDKVRINTNTKKSLFTKNGIKLLLLSIKNYIKHIFCNQKKSLYLGASTGLFIHDNQVLDSYFPYTDLNINDSIYMTNCGNLEKFIEFADFISYNNIVVENYIVGILKNILRLFIFISPEKKRLIEEFYQSLDFEVKSCVDYNSLLRIYKDFIAGYVVYGAFFKLLKIDCAYIVSAPTKSDMIATLKSLNIKIIEIQHGFVGNLHAGYNYKMEQNIILPTPDEIDVYNDFWKKEIISAGYFKESQINIKGRLKYDLVKNNDAYSNVIIFTGQGAFFDEIIDFFINSDAWLFSNDMQLLYKPHPKESKEEIDNFKYKIRMLKSCEVYSGDSTTEELIKNSLAHVSVFSSCHFDAVYYKNKTYIYDIMKDNIMNYYSELYSDTFININNISEIFHESIN